MSWWSRRADAAGVRQRNPNARHEGLRDHASVYASPALAEAVAQLRDCAGWNDCPCKAQVEAVIAAAHEEPVAWRYELAHSVSVDGYSDWRLRITEYCPTVPHGSVRDLTPLYARRGVT